MSGKSIEHFDVPNTDKADLEPLDNSFHNDEQERNLYKPILQISLSSFNSDQKRIFNRIEGCFFESFSIENENEEHPMRDDLPRELLFLLGAPGGTGKTFLLIAIQALMRLNKKKEISVATAAVAAQNLMDGRTAHSSFKLPIPFSYDSTCNLDK